MGRGKIEVDHGSSKDMEKVDQGNSFENFGSQT